MILCLTGFSCAGKTSISRFLVNKHNYELISVRNISHKLAIKNGYSRTREWLNETTISKYLQECRIEMLSIINNNGNFIIDDLFDIQLWHDVTKCYESILINLFLDEKIRVKRIYERESLESISEAYSELEFLDTWKIKFGIKDVMALANYTIDVDNKSIADIAQELMSLIH